MNNSTIEKEKSGTSSNMNKDLLIPEFELVIMIFISEIQGQTRIFDVDREIIMTPPNVRERNFTFDLDEYNQTTGRQSEFRFYHKRKRKFQSTKQF